MRAVRRHALPSSTEFTLPLPLTKPLSVWLIPFLLLRIRTPRKSAPDVFRGDQVPNYRVLGEGLRLRKIPLAALRLLAYGRYAFDWSNSTALFFSLFKGSLAGIGGGLILSD